MGACIFEGACALLLKLKIDDPLSASPMHGVCGAWAVLFVGFLAKKEYVMQVRDYSVGVKLIHCCDTVLDSIHSYRYDEVWAAALYGLVREARGLLSLPCNQPHATCQRTLFNAYALSPALVGVWPCALLWPVLWGWWCPAGITSCWAAGHCCVDVRPHGCLLLGLAGEHRRRRVCMAIHKVLQEQQLGTQFV